MKKLIFTALLLLAELLVGGASNVQAQTIDGDSLIVHLKNGGRVAIAIATIQKITFDTATAGVTSVPATATTLSIGPNFPNPTRSKTNIEFSLPESGRVSIVIYDGNGKNIRQMGFPNYLAGQNVITWDGLDDDGTPVRAGDYFYEVRFGNESQTRRMVVIR